MRSGKPISWMLAVLVLWACATADVRKTAAGFGTAPDFTLPDQNGQSVTLSSVLKDYRGAVLAFYPKDDTRD